jgi:hypothetical protein
MRRLSKAKQRRAGLRIGSLVIVLITVAALVAPVALADKWGTARTSDSGATLRPDDRSGVRSSGPIFVAAAVKAEYRARMLRGEALNRLYGLGGAHVVASTPPAVTVARSGSLALRPDDRSGVRGGAPILVAAPVAPVVAVQTQTENGFQWGDAGIGGAVIFLAMIFAGSILLVARHRTARPSAI